MFLRFYDKTAFIYKGKNISYKELIDKAEFYSAAIDIIPGDRVVIFSENKPEWAYALFGIWRRGGIAVPIDHMASEDEVAFIIQDARPTYAFVSSDLKYTFAKAVKRHRYKVEVIDIEDFIPFQDPKEPITNISEDIALILYTSGTTGQPKGVMLTFGNLQSNIEAIAKENIASSKDVTIALLPFHHAYPLMVSLLVPIYLGATIIFSENLSSSSLVNLIVANKVTALIGVPKLYKILHDKIFGEINNIPVAKKLFSFVDFVGSPKLGKIIFKKVHKSFGGNLKYFISGGAKLDPNIAHDLYMLGFDVLEGYGLTETSPIVSFNVPGSIKIGSVGKPIPGVEVKIAEDGEVLVKGKNVMKGYWQRPDLTNEAIKDGWFYTGDIGYLDEDGYLYIIGRKKELIVLENGKKVIPEEIENLILSKSDIVKEVAVIEQNGHLHAIIVPNFELVKEKGILNLREYITWEVIDKVNRELPSYKNITDFSIREEELPKTRLGKIKRFLLKAQDNVPLKAKEQTYKEEEEKKPIGILTEQEGILLDYLRRYKSDISPKDHIEIDLGLDSLDKVELLSFLDKTFGIQIPEKELSKYLSVEQLMSLVLDKEAKQTKEVNWHDILSETAPAETLEYKDEVLVYGSYLLRQIFKVYFRFQVEGLPNLPKENPFIIAPNHASYLDGFLIAASLPKELIKDTYFVGAKEYFEGKIGDIIAKHFHVIPVDTQSSVKETLIKSAAILKSKKNLVIFPEGARTRNGKLLPFKKGVAILSKELKVPIVPTAIKGSYEAMKIGDIFPKPKKIVVRYGWPLLYYEFSYDEIIGRLEEAVQSLLNLP
ncbi:MULTISPECIES: AMP-binding protein [unclassified Hydrogenobaculum]|uniref:AMP-binding protein n=1 Tax=unclassified Hydrogenobaculum TaxID=2622382 RepID=UPI0001C50A91|nr:MULTISPECIES: AMP-binding protein [unclassified Hydrogenobaculum]AEF19170.1 Long-chain-fatty-acid--CoA ligase., 1-acylglycerol-3-phosphate O-acyltransferase [Hydrogenobaculum sp. 3684]AEG46459.1 Long-chain-fatty-acid--CoA ligase., 1-acylglycerol-3-phosphate O-acyltransferase [Hydrogenobaculum sp. SHO]AGG15103.1 AMP-dependent synthetase and ligase [Hydrogenobaculum sp. HO]AGH93399.1 AMP-forming long-chain acyl-CoA synthetase [Hydrogenobaculum sp. SN]